MPPEKQSPPALYSELHELKKENERLMENNRRLSMVIDGTNAGYWDWNIKTGTLTINERWAEITGHTLEELTPATIELWNRLCHPDDLKRSNALLDRHFDGATQYYETEVRMRHKNGSWIWVLDRGKVFEWDAHDRPLRMVGSHQDITDRKTAEQQLERERKLFFRGPVSVFRWANAPEWPVEYVSPNIRELLGYPPEQLQNGSIRYTDIIHPDDRDFIVSEVEYYSRSTDITSFEQEYRLLKADGSPLWVYDHTVIHRDEEGAVTHYEGYIIDYSSKKESETYQRQRIEFERLIATMSKRFINLALTEIDDALNDILQLIGTHVHADRSYVFQFYDNNTLMDNTHEWCADGIEPQIDKLKGIPANISPWWLRKIIANETIHIPDTDSIPDNEKALQNILKDQDIKSLLVIPLVAEHRVFGYIGFDSVRQHRSWHPETISVLQLAGGVIAGALCRKQTEHLLEAELDLALKLSASTSLQQTLQLCLETAIAISHMDCGGIYMMNPFDNSMELAVHQGLSDSFIRASQFYTADDPRLELVNSGTPVYTSMTSRSTSGTALQQEGIAREEGLKALAILPVKYKGEVIACLNIASHSLNHVPETSRKGVESIISHIGAAILQARHEEQVNETKQNLETLFDTIDDYLFIVDDRGRIIETNQTVYRNLHYRPGELHGKHVLDVHPPEQHETAQRNIEAMLGGTGACCMVPLQTKKGELIPVETRITRGVWNHQPVLFGISRDMTERHKAEKALRESEQRFRELTDLLPQPVFECDTDTTISYANKTALELFGYTQSDLERGLSAFDLVLPERREALNKTRRQLLQGSQRETREFLAMKKNRETFPAVLYATPIMHDDRITGFRGALFDLTQHRKTEQAQRETELKKRIIEKYRNMLHNIPGIVYTKDADGQIDFLLSPKVESMTGYRAEEIGLLKDGWLSLIHPENRKEYIRASAIMEKKPAPMMLTYRIVTKQGREKWFEDRTAPLYTSDRTYSGCDGLIIDITERIVAETEKQELEQQLRQSQRMETIGTLAGGVAHDFNNILMPIMGYAEMLELHIPPDSPESEFASEIRKAAERARHLVEQILTFSRMDESTQCTLNLATVIREALKLLRPSIPSSIAIETDIAPDIEPVMADASQMHQVVINLCTNAYQAMDGGKGTLKITLNTSVPPPGIRQQHPSLDKTPYVTLKVSDTGQGMDSKTVERVFEPFFTTKPVNKGTGLGLSVVHGIISQHNGIITVESTPGKGSVFSIFLPPCSRQPTGRDNARVSPVTLEQQAQGRLLVVDDEEANVNLLSAMLQKAGYTITPATSPAMALACIRQHPDELDLVITDLTMPDMNGIVLASEIHEVRHDLPVLLITGHGDDEALKESARQNNIEQVLQKPVSFTLLQKTITSILAKQNHHRA
ncbi:MAG: PAS domain S-box protein [Prosthecochloris sp.]|nr:PAS domain S-box protein [Prosthecochloris sp.]